LTNVRVELSEKLLSLLRELVPHSSRVAVLWDSTHPDHRVILTHLQVAARTLGVSLHSLPVQRHTEIEPAFAATKKQRSQVLITLWSSILVPRWIADLALRQRLPLTSTSPGYAYEGGVMAYTEDWNAVFDRAAALVDRILKGTKPAEVRRGYEAIKDFDLQGLLPPLTVTPRDHEGGGYMRIIPVTSRWLHQTEKPRIDVGRSSASTWPIRTQIIESPCASA
jgi:hypothetical protein